MAVIDLALSSGSDRRFDMGRVIRRTFDVIRRGWLRLGLLAVFALALPYGALTWATPLMNRWASTAGAPWSYVIVGLLNWLLLLAPSSVLEAGCVAGAMAELSGQRPRSGNAIAQGMTLLAPVIALRFVTGLAESIGLVLLVAPGVLLAAAWTVAVPVRMCERLGLVASLRRSFDLTAGKRWRIIGLAALYFLFAFVPVLIEDMAGLRLSTVSARGEGYVIVIVVRAVAYGLTAVVPFVGVASIYYELRTIKEGVGPDQLAALFD